MTPRQIMLVRDSLQLLGARANDAAVVFYDELFRLAPQVRPLFPEDMREQRRKLIDTLAAVVNGLAYPEGVLPSVRKLGARHSGYQARPEHYRVVGVALITAFRRTLGTAFTPEVEEAWRSCYSLLSREMIGAQQAA